MFSYPVSDTTTGFDVLDLFGERGWVAWRSGSDIVLAIHGKEDGTIPGLQLILDYIKLSPTAVVTCYPVACRRNNPGLPIVGNWVGKTRIESFLGSLEASEQL